MKRFVRNLLLFAVCFFLLAFTTTAHAAGSDLTGWQIEGSDSVDGPFVLGSGDVTSNAQGKPAISVGDAGRAIKNGGSVTTNTNNTDAIRVNGTGSSLELIGVSIVTRGNTSYGCVPVPARRLP